MSPVVPPPPPPRPIHPVALKVEQILQRHVKTAIPLEMLPDLLAEEEGLPKRTLDAILRDLQHEGGRFHLIRPPQRRWVGPVGEGWILLRARRGCRARDPITHHVRESLRLMAGMVDPTSERSLARWNLALIEADALSALITKRLRARTEALTPPPARTTRPRRPASGRRAQPNPHPEHAPSGQTQAHT